MKIITATFLFLVLSFQLFGQEKSDSEITHQIGINVTSFIENFFVLSGNNANPGPYSITYKRIKDGKALRLGFAGRLNIADSSQPGQAVRRNINNLFQLRFGREWRKNISKRWLCFYGGDIIGNLSSRTSSINDGLGNNTTSNTSFGGGLGAIAGIQFKISDRIFLTTEAGFLYNYSFQKFSQTFDAFPELNIDPTTTNFNSLDFELPSAIFFVVSF